MLLLLLSVCLAVGFFYAAYLQRPKTDVIEQPVEVEFTVTSFQNFKFETLINETPVTKTGTIEYSQTKPAYQTKVELAGREASLRYYFLIGVAIFYAIYVVSVLTLYVWNKIQRRPDSKDRDVSDRLNKVIVFAAGAIWGVIANGTPAEKDLELKVLRAELTQVQGKLDDYRSRLIPTKIIGLSRTPIDLTPSPKEDKKQ
jgi:hypothetical protein